MVIVDLQRPKTLSAALSLVTLFHNIGANASAPDQRNVTQWLTQRGLQPVSKHGLWGGAVCGVVARRG
jgi:hypothetical protein